MAGLIISSLIWAIPPLGAENIYDYLDALCKHGTHPRQLNTLDLPQYYPGAQPQPLLIPRGDFNGDGTPDLAVSGIFELPVSSERYFLLVATHDKTTSRPKALYWATYLQPPFLFEKGTTGEGDPNDQAFSLSFCTGCAHGWDFYWNERRGNFDLRPWDDKQVRHTSIVSAQGEIVPAEDVDHALKIVGKLPDVIAFVAGLHKGGRVLGTRVQSDPKSSGDGKYQVILFEKKKEKEKIYDIIHVDLRREVVAGREKRKLSE